MNVYEISYQSALAGEYRERARHTAWDNYFDQMGARVTRPYGDPELELGTDHLQNIVNLIYSGRMHGVDEVRLTLDHQPAQKEAIAHFYALLFLPEVIAVFERDTEPLTLKVTFEVGIGTSSYRRTKPNLDDVPDLETLFDEVEQEIADDKRRPLCERDPFSVGMEALGEAVKTDSRRKVELPNWICEKYYLSEGEADGSKKMAEALSGLVESFGLYEQNQSQQDQ